MKFSFNLIKKLAPGKYTKSELVEKLNLHSFETADLGGDVLEIAITPNRFSDAASYLGIAREASTIFGSKLNDPLQEKLKYDHKDQSIFRVNIKEKKLCRRYLASYANNIKIGQSPKWLKEALETCGLRSINNVVDIMNYVMLETGQPMHAFDADKVSGGLVIRRAQKGESIMTIDNQKFNLDPEILVIADSKNPLAIAGIKGGQSSEISASTKNILVESANFDSANIYLTSKKLGLRTDASIRFSHNLSPELAEIGIRRTLSLLKELTGATIHPLMDVYPKKQTKIVTPWNLKKITELIGYEIKEKEALFILEKLGFQKSGKNIIAPPVRTDIENIEDIAEEIARIQGYENLVPKSPSVAIAIASEDEIVILKDRARKTLTGAGFNEIYNYSLVSKKETGSAPMATLRNSSADFLPVELSNPISQQFSFLRDSLSAGLIKNLGDNLRFFNEVKVFEIGKIFSQDKNGVSEVTALGLALSGKNAILELKGLVETLFQQLGLVDYSFPDLNLSNKLLKNKEALRLETDHKVLGYLGSLNGIQGAMLEINLEKLLKAVDEEKEYEPLSKYPSISRDLSIFVPTETRVGNILEAIQSINQKLVNDVDLIDFYEPSMPLHPTGDRSVEPERKVKSLTFRIIFQSPDKTLTDKEADQEMAAINKILTDKFDAELR